MSYGNRRSIIALGRCLIVCLALAAGVFAQPVGNDASAQPGTKQPKTVIQPNANPPPPTLSPEVKGALDRIGAALETQNAKGEPPEEAKRGDADLQAQQRMALWAKAMFFATAFQALLSGAGIALLIANLKESRKLTKAALKANALAHDAYAAEHRTWVEITPVRAGPVTFEGDKIHMNLSVEVRNVGQRPAVNVRIGYRHFRGRAVAISKKVLAELVAEEIRIADLLKGNGATALMAQDKVTWGLGGEAGTHPTTEEFAARQDAAGVLPENLPLALSSAFFVIYKSLASDAWCCTAHVAFFSKEDGIIFDPAEREVPAANLHTTINPMDTIMT